MAITTLSLLYLVIGIVVSSIVLWLIAAYGFKNKNKQFMTAFLIAAITGAISYVLGLFTYAYMYYVNLAATVIVGIYLVKNWYKLKWSKTFLVWLIWFVVMALVSYVLNLITPVSFATGLVG
ncbi:hypothetical protein KY328_05255 [Candidatus Woesearchaeota archaeon]|nr:hypothetical protein [Candidatus Woesearchaeota archaeon]MBW3022305.1 hypothetical protein [Candidatus Woesearchaeota archaeon]